MADSRDIFRHFSRIIFDDRVYRNVNHDCRILQPWIEEYEVPARYGHNNENIAADRRRNAG